MKLQYLAFLLFLLILLSSNIVSHEEKMVSASRVELPVILATDSSVTQRSFDYVVVIVMENKNFSEILGNVVAAPFINRLAHDNSVAANYHTVSGNWSLPNYLGMIAANTYPSWSACNTAPSLCKGWRPIQDHSVLDLIENAGLSWKAYMEDMPISCYPHDFNKYVVRHDPFVYFASVLAKPEECNKVVPAGNNASRLISDLSSASTASNFMWLTPNNCNNMHDCSVSSGDKYLSQIIPVILSSAIFRTNRSALFLTWDEGRRGTAHMPAIWAGPSVRSNYVSAASYSHYSFLKTIESVWNLPSLTLNDGQAVAMTEFFANRTGTIYYTPTRPLARDSITFTESTTGGTAPFTYAWNFGDGTSATDAAVVHIYRTSASYNVSLTITDAWAHSETRSTVVRVSDFTLNCSKQKLSLTTGASAVSTVTLHSVNGFEGNILLTSNLKDASIYPSQITVPANGSGTATLTFSPKTSGTFVVTVGATYEGVTHMINQTYLVGGAVQEAPNIIGLEPTWFYLTATTAGLFVIVTGLFLQKSGQKRFSN